MAFSMSVFLATRLHIKALKRENQGNVQEDYRGDWHGLTRWVVHLVFTTIYRSKVLTSTLIDGFGGYSTLETLKAYVNGQTTTD
ncbi:hypothetical protein HW44_10930 [Nitrosococcus oceani]|nr:hypothetical protein HW44_10930 [Nitrosococcus oceani]